MTAKNIIMSLLNTSADIADKISLWTKISTEYKMIFNGWMIPTITADSYKKNSAASSETDLITNGQLEPNVLFNTINFYRETSINGFLPHIEADYSINCRAYTQSDSEAIAAAVNTALNRMSGQGYSIICTIEAAIPPADKTDNYNTRVTAKIKTTE